MSQFFQSLLEFIVSSAPWWGTMLIAFVLTLVLTPPVREFNRRRGMVDKPSARRINKTPIPRGGGLAIFFAVTITCFAFPYIFNRPMVNGYDELGSCRFLLPPVLLVTLGYADDRFSLPPHLKLLGQVLIALLAVWVCGIGFGKVFPWLPGWLDCVITVLWLVGAINAFNLIDGLDGLASGLSLIAVAGMAGALFCVGASDLTFVHFALMGALGGFLRYNFYPASVFLGDCGSMYLGYLVAALPLVTRASNSFIIAVGIPLLAMGVPIFDTALAILRRTLRALLQHRLPGGAIGNDKVMTADTDHLHHRILRRLVSQRKVAFVLYAFASLLVLLGLAGVFLEGRAAAVFIIGFMVVGYIVVRDMRRIELWDAGRLLDLVAHDRSLKLRKRRYLLHGPLLIVADIMVLAGIWVLVSAILSLPLTENTVIRGSLMRIVPIIIALCAFRVYSTVWSRAQLSNYLRLAGAVVCGSAVCCAMVILGNLPHNHLLVYTATYTVFATAGLIAVRMLRATVRDVFYTLNAGRMLESNEVQRVVVYGAGLRYRYFRRELVRLAAAGNRVVVGLIDDDILLKGQYIGGIRIHGALEQAPEILRRLRADAVVVAAELTPQRRQIARQIFAECGVKVTYFEFRESPL